MSCHPDLKQYAFCGFNLLSWIGSVLRSRVPSRDPSGAPFVPVVGGLGQERRPLTLAGNLSGNARDHRERPCAPQESATFAIRRWGRVRTLAGDSIH